MASVWRLQLLFTSFVMSAVSVDVQLIKVEPKQAVAGVFEASVGKNYSLTAATARDVCEQLGVTIASKAQVTEAHKHGLETCRFGWIDEQIAVIPRVRVKSNCGNGGTGVVVWRADLSQMFDVFCFNLTDFEIHNQVSKTADQRSPEKPVPTTPKPSSSSELSFSSVPPARSHHPSLDYTEDRENHSPVSGSRASIGVVPVALLITVSFAVLLAVFLSPYYSRINRSCRMFCHNKQKEENIEAEVWEHCSKKELQESQEENMDEKDESNNNNNSSSDQD